MNPAYIQSCRQKATEWAQALLKIPVGNWIILDTETTGLGDLDEIVQIGVTDGAGNVLMDNILVKPSCPISAEAQAVHHISSEMVAHAPSFQPVYEKLVEIVEGKIVVIYNRAFDKRMIEQSIKRFNGAPPLVPSRWECAMLRHAEWVGQWNEYHRSFRWQKLVGGDHSAVGDCLATLKVIRQMARLLEKEDQARAIRAAVL
jgi:DNA polymerase-3 subunit epsilon